jgi:two-component system phosphate regulon sensor histidine kinase PhoR
VYPFDGAFVGKTRNLMFRSIRWRITIPYVVLSLMTMLALGIYLSSFVRKNHLKDLETSLHSQVLIISDALFPILSNGITTGDDIDNLANTWAELLDARVTVLDANGVVLGESHDDAMTMDNHLNRLEVYQAIQNGSGSSIRTSATVGYEMIYVASPVEDNGKILGIVRIALPTEEINKKIANLHRTIFYASLIAAGATIALSILIAHLTTKPIIELTRVANQMVQTQSDLPSPMMGYDEVGQLANAFNAIVSQLCTQIKALETEQSTLANVLEQMTDGVIIADEDGIVKMINPTAISMFDVEEPYTEGHTLIYTIRNHQVVELWQQCKQTGEEQALTLEIPRYHKFFQCVITSLQPVLPGQYLLLFQDLTRMRRLETVRRDFISNISHELRTPLASLKALTETLQGGAIDDPPAAMRFLDRMETEVDALTQMVSELLELTRIESGQVPLEFQPVEPKDLLNHAIERLVVQAERAQVHIELDCPDNLPHVIADPPRLGQALVNLLHNAIKFTPPEGEISLNARLKGYSVVFTIHDTGVGIPADDLPRIFERFYKADRARSSGGTGLGLAITRHIVEAHGGKIWAESIEGRGSKFSFSIPIEM